jgi:outer membrane PBP1 activator LpoA protein
MGLHQGTSLVNAWADFVLTTSITSGCLNFVTHIQVQKLEVCTNWKSLAPKTRLHKTMLKKLHTYQSQNASHWTLSSTAWIPCKKQRQSTEMLKSIASSIQTEQWQKTSLWAVRVNILSLNYKILIPDFKEIFCYLLSACTMLYYFLHHFQGQSVLYILILFFSTFSRVVSLHNRKKYMDLSTVWF